MTEHFYRKLSSRNHWLLFWLINMSIFNVNAQFSLDLNFDGDGLATSDLLSSHDLATSVIVQPDGKILIGGYSIGSTAGSHYDYSFARFHTDGSPDYSFSLNGEASFGIMAGEADALSKIALLPDGGILAAGWSSDGSTAQISALSLKASGTAFNTSFGNNGKFLEDFGTSLTICNDMVVQPDGKILLVGRALVNGEELLTVFRLNENGTVDNTFSTDGKAGISFDTDYTQQWGKALALQPDGKIIVVGNRPSLGTGPFDYPLLIARLNPNGSMDNTFSVDGKVKVNVGDQAVASSVLVQPDGKIVIGGSGIDPASGLSRMLAVRLNANGTIDYSFSNDGYILLDPASGNSDKNEYGVKILRQPDGNYLVMGETYSQKPVLWRLQSNGSPAFYGASYSYKVFDVPGNFKPVDMTFGHNGRIVIAGEFEPGGVGTYKEFAVIQINDALAVGTNEQDNLGVSLIYPNPTKDQATFEFELRESGFVSLALYDTQGRSLHHFLTQAFYPSGKNRMTLQLPLNLPKGIYLLRLSTNKSSVFERLIIGN